MHHATSTGGTNAGALPRILYHPLGECPKATCPRIVYAIDTMESDAMQGNRTIRNRFDHSSVVVVAVGAFATVPFVLLFLHACFAAH